MGAGRTTRAAKERRRERGEIATRARGGANLPTVSAGATPAATPPELGNTRDLASADERLVREGSSITPTAIWEIAPDGRAHRRRPGSRRTTTGRQGVRRDPCPRRPHDGGPDGMGGAAARAGHRAHEPTGPTRRHRGGRPGRSGPRMSTSSARPDACAGFRRTSEAAEWPGQARQLQRLAGVRASAGGDRQGPHRLPLPAHGPCWSNWVTHGKRATCRADQPPGWGCRASVRPSSRYFPAFLRHDLGLPPAS
jgi:hypothetical protein